MSKVKIYPPLTDMYEESVPPEELEQDPSGFNTFTRILGTKDWEIVSGPENRTYVISEDYVEEHTFNSHIRLHEDYGNTCVVGKALEIQGFDDDGNAIFFQN